jgi:isoleucyl-tRNA synthetase
MDLPANVAIAVHPDFEYAWVESEGEVYLMAKELMASVGKVCHKEFTNILGTVKGKDLEGVVARHLSLTEIPWLFLLTMLRLTPAAAAFIQSWSWPGDFETGLRYKLPIISPLINPVI